MCFFCLGEVWKNLEVNAVEAVDLFVLFGGRVGCAKVYKYSDMTGYDM